MIKKILILALIINIYPLVLKYSYSVEPDEVLNNKKYEERARNISKKIRCMVCQNQSIDDSNAPLAKDLRILIRKKIKNGKSDNEIYEFLFDRYGDFILLKPPIKLNTALLWFLPLVFVFIGVYIILLNNKKSKEN